jgi:YcxB-like protein
MTTPDTPIEYSGRLTAEEITTVMLRRLRRRRLYPMVLGWTAVLLIGSVLMQQQHGTWFSRILPAALFALTSMGLILIVMPLRVRQTIEKQSVLYDDFTTRIDRNGFETHSARDQQRRAWTDFVGWSEDDVTFILTEPGERIRIIPKRLLGDRTTEDRLRAMFVQYIRAA